MPFVFDYEKICPACPFGVCVEDRRKKPVPGRSTQFRLRQNVAVQCTFGEFAPGTDNDPDPNRTFDEYLNQFRRNTENGGRVHFGADFDLLPSAFSKVEGDVFEIIEAAALWNAFAAWNSFMVTGVWPSKVFSPPANSVATPTRAIAAVKLPRGYDTTLLFRDEVRREVRAFEESLKRREMELGLSAPDIVGVRIPHPLPEELKPFFESLPNLGEASRTLLEGMHKRLEGKLEGRSFLFALAVKRTTRSDRLYQPLFEANVLKFLIQTVLRGPAFRFYVHMGSFEGADVKGHYSAASLVSLLQGGEFTRAVDGTYKAERPVEAAQALLNDVTLFPL